MRRKTKTFPRAKNLNVTQSFLDERTQWSIQKGYKKQKWIEFCEAMLSKGWKVSLYEAVRTFSKYVTVSDQSGKSFKVRFSNHRPIKRREAQGDCDFFVGVTNFTTTTTEQAIEATIQLMKGCSDVDA